MKTYNITLIPGDGIGPEVTSATLEVLQATGINFNFDYALVGQQSLDKNKVLITSHVLNNIEQNAVILKGPLMTPIGEGFTSVNVTLRKTFDLYANIRPVKSHNLRKSQAIDMVIFRENTEGLYVGEEVEVSKDEYHAIKKVTRTGSERIIRAAFEYAQANGIEKVTLVHKANILKKTDGLFLNIGRALSKTYKIPLEEVLVDNMCMQMVMHPEQFNVIVTTNLYGDILSDLAAGLVGGLGLIPSGNVGKKVAMFEAVHGTAPDIAGKNIANPIAMVLASAMMLHHLGESKKAVCIEKAVLKVLQSGQIKTQDLGGYHTTLDMKNAIIKEMKVT